MQVRNGMSDVVLTVGPGHTLRQAASLMAARHVGAAVGEDPDKERVSGHLTSNLTFASPDWSLEQAAAAMVRGKFRHLIVVEGSELVGILSMRDIVRCWTEDGATSEMPATASA